LSHTSGTDPRPNAQGAKVMIANETAFVNTYTQFLCFALNRT